MLTPKTLLAALLSITPLVVFADAATDRKVEEIAKASHTFRRVLNNDIDVKVRDGVATLTGRVRDLDQSRLAEDTMASIEGVRRVVNQIKVDPKAGGASDEWLAVKIRSKLLLNRDISLTHTKVDVKDGVVTLTGTAESSVQKARTESAIKEITGVRQVKNHLEIAARTADGERRGGSDSGEPGLPPGAGLPTGRTSMPIERTSSGSGIEDTAISTQVRFQLISDNETSGAKANVQTTDGRVTITGEADSAAQRDRVTELARQVRGVSQVDNRMNIRHPAGSAR